MNDSTSNLFSDTSCFVSARSAMPVIIAAAVIIIITLFYIHFTKYNDEWIEKNVAGPEPTLFFGNVEDAVLGRKHIGEVFKDIYNAYPEEKVVGIFVMRNPELLVRDTDIVKEILIKDDVFVNRGVEFESDFAVDILHGNNTGGIKSDVFNLFSAEGLEIMQHVLEQGDVFVKYVDRITELKQEQDAHSLVLKYTQSTVAALFGVTIDMFNDDQTTLINQNVCPFNFSQQIDMMYPGIVKKLRNFLSKNTHPLLLNMVKKIHRNCGPSSKDRFIELIVKSRTQGPNKLEITDESIALQAYNIYATVPEVIASTLSFLLYQLALNPSVQDNVAAEIKSFLRKHKEIKIQDVLDLSYMGKVIKETLRMYPVIPELRRKLNIDYKIQGTNYTLEKDQFIRISVLGLHYDEKIYPKPEVFDPDRFSTEVVEARHECSYLPFGLAPGNRIGMRFTQVLLRVCLVKLLSQYRVEPSRNTPIQVEYHPTRPLLSPKAGLLIKFVKKEPSS